MFLVKFLIAALVFLVAQAAGATIIMGPFTSGPADGTLLYQMNFEGSGCVDSVTSLECDTDGSADTDYNTPPAPLEGLLSVYLPSGDWVRKFNSFTPTLTATWDMLLNYTILNTDTTLRTSYALFSATNNWCSFNSRGNSERVWADVRGGSAGALIQITPGDTYRSRLEWDSAAATCTVCLDDTDTAWGTCDAGTSTATGGDTGTVNGWYVINIPEVLQERVADGIGICAGVGLVGQCGPSPLPGPPAVLWAMDFEGSGCVDTDSGSTCSSTGGTLDMDSTAGVAPLEGSLSAAVGSDGFIYASAVFDAGTNDVTLDLLVHFDVFSNLGINTPLFELWGDGAFRCVILGRPDSETIWAYTGQPGAGIDITAGTTYRLRLEWNRATKLCSLAADTTATAWGAGAVGTSSATNISWTPGAITEFRVADVNTVRIIRIVDDIGICEGISLGTTKCGD